MGIHAELFFVIKSLLLGAGLAMDAFSVSLANGLNDPGMRIKKMCSTAGIFALLQAAMPMAGWICVHTIVRQVSAFEQFIPWLALALLGYIGGKMLWEGIRPGEKEEQPPITFSALLTQGIATSLDAFSVGFTISGYGIEMALLCAAIIAAVTFVICMAGLTVGKQFGTKLSTGAAVFGGILLIAIGLEIFLKFYLPFFA